MLDLSGIITREIAFGGFLLDQFVVDPFRLAVIDRALSFGAGAECLTTTAIRKVNHEAFALWTNAGLIHLVG